MEIHGKNGNGTLGYRKIGQQKNKTVGKNGNEKLMSEITATEKRQWKKRQPENGQRKMGR